MEINTHDIVTATDVNRKASRLITEASAGRTFVVMKDNAPTAWIVGRERMERLTELETMASELAERESDLKLLALALVRSATDTGARYSLDDVVAELGIDED